jgi:hypothetical protein
MVKKMRSPRKDKDHGKGGGVSYNKKDTAETRNMKVKKVEGGWM